MLREVGFAEVSKSAGIKESVKEYWPHPLTTDITTKYVPGAAVKDDPAKGCCCGSYRLSAKLAEGGGVKVTETPSTEPM